jgi:hypothetical protein
MMGEHALTNKSPSSSSITGNAIFSFISVTSLQRLRRSSLFKLAGNTNFHPTYSYNAFNAGKVPLFYRLFLFCCSCAAGNKKTMRGKQRRIVF